MTEPTPNKVNPIEYKCSNCGQPKERADLLARRVVYTTMGKPVRTVRSRVAGWWCSACRAQDPHWTSPPHAASPGAVEQHNRKEQSG